jgi:ankyrin repeat protein
MTALAALTRTLKNVKDDQHRIASVLDAHAMLLEHKGGVELLHWAIDSKREDVVRALAQRGVDMEGRVPKKVLGWTPLQKAAFKGNEQLVRILLEQGADATNQGRIHRTPLFLVMISFSWVQEGSPTVRDYMNVAKLLLKHMDKEALELRDYSHHLTALAYAARDMPVEMVTLLLDHGANARANNYQGTPLMLAATRGDAGLAVVKALLKHLKPQDLDAKDAGGARTALHHACRFAWFKTRQRMEMVMVLLQAGANPTTRDKEGKTPRALAEEQADAVCRAELMAAFEVSRSTTRLPSFGLPPSRMETRRAHAERALLAVCAMTVVGGTARVSLPPAASQAPDGRAQSCGLSQGSSGGGASTA